MHAEAFHQFVQQCMYKEQRKRPPSEVLLGSPWFQKFGVSSLSIAVDIVHEWLSTTPKKKKGGDGGKATTGNVEERMDFREGKMEEESASAHRKK